MLTREAFRQLCEEKILILDGATGTNLMRAGMTMGCCPEKWILDHPQVLLDLQQAYAEAGSDIILAPTFTANAVKLAEYGLAEDCGPINRQLMALTRSAAGGRAYVAADMTMTGRQLMPMGDMDFETLVEVYKQQAAFILEEDPDLFFIETMMSLNECRAALLAIRELCDLPVCVTLSFDESGRTLFGTDPATAVTVLQAMGADAVGVNCSTGPEQMTELVRIMKAHAHIPVIAKPNAGMPELVDGETVYSMSPEAFARASRQLYEAGAGILGGCCGTTPEHIRSLSAALGDVRPPVISRKRRRALAGERRTLTFDLDERFLVIGERINPTGKKKLQAALREAQMDYVADLAQAQAGAGADILDVNMGMNGIDEKAMMIKSIETVTSAVDLPLCIDSSHIDVIEAALRIYPGRALVNSISLEKEKFEKLLPIARKYGAMFILLPLSDAGLPKDMAEKKQIIRTIMDRALSLGFVKEDIIVDGLVTTIGANKNAALETLETIRWCHDELGLATVCGLSNISFGLPERICVNTAFLTMAIGRGLTMAIANPSQEQLMNAAFASDLLMNREGSDIRYIERMNRLAEEREAEKARAAAAQPAKAENAAGSVPAGAKAEKAAESVLAKAKAEEKTAAKSDAKAAEPAFEGSSGPALKAVYQAVLKGSRKKAADLVQAALDQKIPADVILNEALIPGIGRVGHLFEKQKYFLPQLIASAQTMEQGIAVLEPYLAGQAGEEKATVVIATVEGDIHDIGKNLVALMLRNYGYRVIDLGKDVTKEEIVAAAIREKAQLIGLSALMTTTMMRMKDVVEYAALQGCTSQVMIGGAVTTQSFADEIGAHGYSADAAEAVQLAEKLLAMH